MWPESILYQIIPLTLQIIGLHYEQISTFHRSTCSQIVWLPHWFNAWNHTFTDKCLPLVLSQIWSNVWLYQRESRQCFVCKSSSPAGAGFFFVGKKYRSIRPFIKYRGLNKITIKNRCLLHLITELFDRIQGAKNHLFAKLEKCLSIPVSPSLDISFQSKTCI